MLDDLKVLAVIPARKGSKRLPKKNTMSLAGKPLISYTIEAAINSQFVDNVVVSTDCEDIAKVAIDSGASVPFMRPSTLADDTSTSIDVVINVVEELEKIGSAYDVVILLQPTSPLRCAADIDGAFSLFDKNNADAVVSVCEVEHPPLWTNTLPENMSLDGFLSSDVLNKRSQDLPPYFRINGAIYIIRNKKLKEGKTFFPNQKSYAYIMQVERSVDIDTLTDFKFAQLLIES